ncbi:MAG TPA: sulfoacetate transporter [Hyphomonas adhaerens]|uniref:Probable membrane transporter protein n=1 Tax=Hyphomonas adhaerens TaxID=81029 RepID=A0A3B9GYY9_9PROT|nr:sulfite exporter TauE/SafE family protein [Hyphomonas sp.]MBB40379.1 sulfoacetate transporter [Hyphomonas sp.]HAE27214.1 sulfoacetate transporter [Hyphomonas adhaerens]
MAYVLPVIFFITAALYASVGFGGGSTYNAVLILSGADFRIVPIIALACNILVVTGNTLRYGMAGDLDWRALLPALALSVPLAWLGGRVPVNEFVFSALLGITLMFTGLSMLFQNSWKQTRDAPSSSRAMILLPVGAGTGFLAGLVGIGGGIFLAPVLYWIRWSHEKAIAAACSLFILLNSLSGLAGQATKLSNVGTLQLATPYLPLLPAVLVGGWIGNRYGVLRMQPNHLRYGTAILILVVAARLLYKVWRTA